MPKAIWSSRAGRAVIILRRRCVGRLDMDDKYGILHLVDPAQISVGDELISVARGLSPDYYEVTVAGPLPADLRRRLSRHQVRWVNLPLLTRGSLRGCLSAARQTRRLLASKAVDLIHAHGLSAALVALLARSRRPLPVVCTLYGLTPNGLTFLRRLGVRWILEHCDELILRSAAQRDVVAAIAPRAARTAQVVYPAVRATRSPGLYDVGVKRQQLGLHPAAAIVGVLGLPDAKQTTDIWLRAAALVSSQMPNVEFAIIGAGSERAALGQSVHNSGIGGACVFLDDRRAQEETIMALDVLVLVSETAGTPTQGLTALAADIPVIAVDSAPLVEILGDLPNVRLVEADSVEGMAAALTELLSTVPADEGGFEMVSTTGARLKLWEVLVSQQSYDLQEKWPAADSGGASQPSAAVVLARYGIQRLVAQMEKVYYQALQ